MDFLTQLWLPILLAAVAVWIYSAVAWMVLPHHTNDQRGLPDEDAALDAIRALGVPPGNYGFPRPANKAACKDPAFVEKWKRGPAGTLNIWPEFNMGRNMVLSFIVYLLISTLIAYLGAAALTPGTSFGKVFQVLGVAGILAYTTSGLTNAIWFQASRNAVLSNAFDGIVSGLITGAIFASLWPGA